MQLNAKALLNLPVVTKSGKALGKLASFEIDADTGTITTLHVKTPGVVSGLLSDELLVSWAAVIELTPERVVVTDATATAGMRAIAKGADASSPIMAKRMT